MEEVQHDRITFEYEGTEYILEFDRETAQKAELTFDVSMSELLSGKTAMMYALFTAAFMKHHPRIKPTTVRMFWERMPEKQELYAALVAMYGNTVGTLLEDPEEGKAISWKMS